MPVQFKIRITKEIIEHCKYCGTETSRQDIGSSCAIAVALKDIFPDVYVTDCYIFPFGVDTANGKNITIMLPVIAQQFIKLFDGFRLMPNLRISLPEFDFIIDIPTELLDLINIDEVRELIKGSRKTANLVVN